MEDPSYVHDDEWHLNDAYGEDPTLLPISASASFGENLLQQQYSFCNDNMMNPNCISCMQTSSSIINGERPTKQIKTTSNINTTSKSTSCCWSPDQTLSDHQLQFASSCPNFVSFVNQQKNYINHQVGLTGKIIYEDETILLSPKVLNGGTTNVPADEDHVLMMMMSQQSLGNPKNSGGFIKTRTSQIDHPARKKIGTTVNPKNNNYNNRSVSEQPVQDHIIAERKRREKLSQKFIALSALVPGLKKMDKASVLEDAIKYMKQLQEKVRVLEEEQKKAKTVESVVIVRKFPILPSSDSESSSDSGNGGGSGSSSSLNDTILVLPEIEARFYERSVLIRIHCEKIKGVLEKAIGVIEDLYLTVTNSSAFTFGSAALDITIIAQMDSEFCMTLEDLVGNLRSAFKPFM